MSSHCCLSTRPSSPPCTHTVSLSVAYPITASQVGTAAQLDAATESLATMVPAAHAVIDAAKVKDVTSITEPVTV